EGNPEKTRLIPAAFLAALLFGLQPIHVESVAWATERTDLLCGFFYLASLLLYLHYAPLSQVKPWKPAACLGLFFLALLSKPMAVTLPLVLVLLDAWPLRKLRPPLAKYLAAKAPFFALAAAG